jgi:hypothetical protein
LLLKRNPPQTKEGRGRRQLERGLVEHSVGYHRAGPGTPFGAGLADLPGDRPPHRVKRVRNLSALVGGPVAEDIHQAPGRHVRSYVFHLPKHAPRLCSSCSPPLPPLGVRPRAGYKSGPPFGETHIKHESI